MEADAASPCAMSNGSLLYKYRTTLAEFKNNTKPSKEVKYDASKTYFTLYIGDYDSSAWMKKYVADYWRDGTNATVPMLWCFNPNLSQRIPVVWDYVYSHIGENDYIAAGEGAGYTMPNNFGKNEETKATRDYNEGWAKWVEYNKQYYDLFDMNITGFIIDKTRLSNEVFSAYSQFSPVGAFHNDSSKRLAVYGDTVYAYLFNEVTFTDEEGKNSNAEKVDFSNPNMVKVFKNMASYCVLRRCGGKAVRSELG